MFSKNYSLAEKERKILYSLAQKGAEGAAVAISKMVNREVKLKVQEVSALPIEKISNVVFNTEMIVTAIYLKITGDAAGSILLIFPNPCAFVLVELLLGRKKDGITKLSDYEKSVLKEVSNIISGSFLKTLSDYLQLSMVESIPDLAVDMAKAAMDSVLIDFAKKSQNALAINMIFETKEKEISGNFFVLFDTSSAEAILNALGKKANE